MAKKKKKQRVDFNNLYRLYKQGKLDEARAILYENMNRFLTMGSHAIINNQWNMYEDIRSDMFLKIEEWILKSIKKDFKEKQTYTYIKCRIRNTYLNMINPNRGKNKDLFFDMSCPILGAKFKESNKDIEKTFVVDEIRKIVFDMSGLMQRIMCIVLYSGRNYGVQSLSKLVGENTETVKKILKEGRDIIKSKLHKEKHIYFNNESYEVPS